MSRRLALVECTLLLLCSASLPAIGRTWRVDAAGGGDFRKVSEACAVADTADTVLIAPGDYDEVVDESNRVEIQNLKALTIKGDTEDPAAVRLRLRLALFSCEDTVVEDLCFHDSPTALAVVGGSAIITSCRFEKNVRASHLASGIAVAIQSATGAIEDCIFVGNAGDAPGAIGGAVENQGRDLAIRRCLFVDNRADEMGGAIWSAAAVTVEDCVFFRNQSANGAAVTLGGGSIMNRCTFLANKVTSSYGAAVEMDFGYNDGVSHCIIAGTVGGYGMGCHWVVPVNCTDAWDNDLGNYVGECIGSGGYGNFSEDPMFCDVTTGDVGLLQGSPCLPGNLHDGFDCGLVGVRGQVCGIVRVQRTTWGTIKALFR